MAYKRKVVVEQSVAPGVPAGFLAGLTNRDRVAVELLFLSVSQTGKIHWDVIDNIVKVADTLADRLGW